MSVPIRSAAPITHCLILAGREDEAPPLLDPLIDETARFGIDSFFVLCGDGVPLGTDVGGTRQARDGRLLTVTVEKAEPHGGMGGINRLLDRLAETFLVIDSDRFFDCNVADLMRPPLAPGCILRLARCREHGGQSPRGLSAGVAGRIRSGIGYARREILSLLDAVPRSLEDDILPRLSSAQAVEEREMNGRLIALDAACAGLFPIRRAAVFFDRDGVLNEDSGYVFRPDQLRWLPGARECVRGVNDSGRFAFVVTNQSGIARGYYDEEAVRTFHAEMQRQLLAFGAHIDAFVFCPHHPEGTVASYSRPCDCRKPTPGMIKQLLCAWPVCREESILIGDRPSDLAAAEGAGIAGRLYESGDLRQFL